MSSEPWDRDVFDVVKSEHEELATVLQEAQEALSSQEPVRGRIDDLITRLSEVVEAHFRHEEHGGYLRGALERSPDLSTQADVLFEQHAVLLEEVEKLRLLIHSGVESAAWWARIRSDFQKFASHLLVHEQSEQELIRRAFHHGLPASDSSPSGP